MKNLKTVPQLLQIEQEDYENQRLEIYFRWCIGFAKDKDADLQKLLANKAISTYWNYEFTKLEKEFVESASLIAGKKTKKQMAHIFVAITSTIVERFPMPLFESARQLSIINQINHD